jgi:cell migration-inducing and hyaluronan-binding protein
VSISRRFLLSFALYLLFVCAIFLPGRGLAAVCNDDNMQYLPAGSATTDLEVTGPCDVKAGTYTFRNVNIYTPSDQMTGGSLHFDDAVIDFYAESIVVEKGGSLIAGSTTAPIGTNSGIVTIHLWGKAGDPGVTCKSDKVNQCGVSNTIWTSNDPPNPASCTQMVLPGPVTDCFYRYQALDPSDQTINKGAYFGHKVLAISYGGTLQLFGKDGATYADHEISTCEEDDPACTGTSWLRLKGTLKPGATTLVVDGEVNWQDQDHIVVTTTDYLPGHSEELIINGDPQYDDTTKTTTINFTNADSAVTGVKWPHNGQTFDLTTASYPDIGRLGLNITSADTRAAVALLTRSIRIVSEGDTPTKNSFTQTAGNYFGGHTIFRQGFASVQVQGVEFKQLGQGGSIMHYPVHFHMDRKVPADTFVKDSSVSDSMTRFMVVHATQGVLLARNVGYKSIGHGFYLEDGTETDNELYANIGIFARAAVDNKENPRDVPGILTANDKNCTNGAKTCAAGYDNFPYYSDANHPSVFWITNGMNDFEYNMAAGAGTCGACYWFVPAAISGPSRDEKWFGYASEQAGAGRAGITPLERFLGNTCTSAMTAFQEVGDTASCNGVNFIDYKNVKPGSTLKMLASPEAMKHSIAPPDLSYWPIVSGGGRLATRCPAADNGDATADCSQVNVCAAGDKRNCDVIVLDHFTTSFNWPQKNFAAIWMRPFWSLIINSVITDVQNAGVNFVTSGDYSNASVIPGFWALLRKSALIGSTQWKNPKSDLKDNPLAANVGPFNPFTSADLKISGMACGAEPNGNLYNPSYCISKDEGIAMQLEAFSNFQRMFSIYDGPAYQDSNAYLDIEPTYLTKDGTATGALLNPPCKPEKNNGNPCATAGFKDSFLPGLRADQEHKLCYIPNAAIGWKQSNGFYYAPAFHSVNLFFDNVGIRHFVTEPLFEPGLFSFKTDLQEAKREYCYWTPDLFNGFTDIDRETVLNDDDGTLTGLTSSVYAPDPQKTETISVNKEDFFDAPSETAECASDVAANPDANPKCAPNTAKTSPYQYVTTAVYPECALSVPNSNDLVRKCADDSWGSACSTSPPITGGCLGIPIYRQLLKNDEHVGLKQVKRMMGQNTFQRSALTVNNGTYYIDTTVKKETQKIHHADSVNEFQPGGKYDIFFLYANKNTKQVYQLYVGKHIPDEQGRMFDKNNVKFGYVDITTSKYKFSQQGNGDLPTGWDTHYEKNTGILTLSTNMLSLADDFDLTKSDPNTNPPVALGKELCQPATMCKWTSKQCQCNPDSPLYDLCNQKNPAGQTVCSWSVKDLDCPAQGCPAFQITFPDKMYFKAENQHERPKPADFNFDTNKGFDWNVNFNLEGTSISGQQCNYTSQPPPLCRIANPHSRR